MPSSSEKMDKPRVLIVEDEGYVLDELKEIMSGFPDFETEWIETGEDARARLEGGKYDIVVSDIYVRGLSGLEALHKTLEKNPGAAFIAITGIDNADLAEKALKEGAYAYVLKPASVYKVKNIIRLLRAVKGYY